jgi:hypothetical protein
MYQLSVLTVRCVSMWLHFISGYGTFDCIRNVVSGRKIMWWTVEDLERSACGLYQGTVVAFVWRTEENHKSSSFGRVSNLRTPHYKAHTFQPPYSNIAPDTLTEGKFCWCYGNSPPPLNITLKVTVNFLSVLILECYWDVFTVKKVSAVIVTMYTSSLWENIAVEC